MALVEEVRKSHVDGLRAMRDKLAVDMEAAEPSVVAQIAGRLQAVLTEIAALEKAAPEQGDIVDEVAQHRVARQSVAQRRVTPERQRR